MCIHVCTHIYVHADMYADTCTVHIVCAFPHLLSQMVFIYLLIQILVHALLTKSCSEHWKSIRSRDMPCSNGKQQIMQGLYGSN